MNRLHAEVKKILAYHWTPWLERPHETFVLSLFQEGTVRRFMREAGVDVEGPVFLLQAGEYYQAPEAMQPFADRLRQWLAKGGSVENVVRLCEQFYRRNLPLFRRLARGPHTVSALRQIHHALAVNGSFVWLAHGFEVVFGEIARDRVPKYIQGDVELFIGDMSFPTKKTAYARFENAMRQGVNPRTLKEKFGWLKGRDGFSSGFTVSEITKAGRRLRGTKPEIHVPRPIPAPLRRLARTLQVLVYLRTFRTDVFYELMYCARPVFRSFAKRYGIPFNQLRYYTLHDLILGRPRNFSKTLTFIGVRGQLLQFPRRLISDATIRHEEVRGVVAFQGSVQGVARVVRSPDELGKVRAGDILVTPMTTPAFVLAMKRAGAFVTDEGGITCHAAIVAREMKKPCIIGTKIATQVLKDGDRVEVDATRGIVRKL